MTGNLYSVIAICIVFNNYCSEYLNFSAIAYGGASPIADCHSLPQVTGRILLK
ncbi:MAG: hypothetical protein HWQ43_07725 [Nostoc sp. JL31]|uniref:hypothetical protein n=1 Tax=Nostoc sp. JL31 TaxID=2815395 RepID=UPI0025E7658E|nr:hypothetical protein [Nostoc sp. JL31]MBN3889056.1 hypothetical protein [Nostoc sp. JL31]